MHIYSEVVDHQFVSTFLRYHVGKLNKYTSLFKSFWRIAMFPIKCCPFSLFLKPNPHILVVVELISDISKAIIGFFLCETNMWAYNKLLLVVTGVTKLFFLNGYSLCALATQKLCLKLRKKGFVEKVIFLWKKLNVTQYLISVILRTWCWFYCAFQMEWDRPTYILNTY